MTRFTIEDNGKHIVECGPNAIATGIYRYMMNEQADEHPSDFYLVCRDLALRIKELQRRDRANDR